MSSIVRLVSQSKSQFLSITFATIIGFSMIYIVGHVQSHMPHESAHNGQHANGFRCH